jgi:hypothetical protein
MTLEEPPLSRSRGPAAFPLLAQGDEGEKRKFKELDVVFLRRHGSMPTIPVTLRSS